MGFRTLVVGDVRAVEFRESMARLRELSEVRATEQFEEALLDCETAPPDLIVLAQGRPAKYSATHIQRLNSVAPLARLVALLGAWCEGEVRTGSPWPGVERLYWHQFPARIASWSKAPPTLRLPKTSTATEHVLHQPHAVQRRGLILVRSLDGETYETIGESLSAAGHSVVRWQSGLGHHVHGALSGLWDCVTDVSADRVALSQFVADLSGIPVIVLAGFPREADRVAAQAAGAAGLLSKPYLASDLMAKLREDQPETTLRFRPPGWRVQRHVQSARTAVE